MWYASLMFGNDGNVGVSMLDSASSMCCGIGFGLSSEASLDGRTDDGRDCVVLRGVGGVGKSAHR